MTTAPNQDDPYCRACGYPLKGLIDATRCPECGRPIVEVLVRGSQTNRRRSIRYESERRLLGRPLVSIARGPIAGERCGHARGIIAIGDLAIGGLARGGIAIGGCSAGVVAIGGATVGAAAVGSLAVGVVAVGAVAAGAFSIGSVSLYVVKGIGAARFKLWRF